MFFIDKPYVSDFFKLTALENNLPIVETKIAKEIGLYNGTKIISEEEAIKLARDSENPSIYTISENSISWISKNLAFSDLPVQINLFKNKVKFRDLTKPLFPNLFYKEIKVEEFQNIEFEKLPLPFIIKPISGFFSMGVYKVSCFQDWLSTIELIKKEIIQHKDLYPTDVVDTSAFIIEECIEGEEYAIDAYFNSSGKPVILSIMKHLFSSGDDVSDRVYVSSKEIIEDNIIEFTTFLKNIGELANVKNFPLHLELRKSKNGALLPIEVNPLRFGGWCTTADVSFFAYGFNPYVYYYLQKTPNWKELLKGKEGKLYSVIVLDNSSGIDANQIISFDYDGLLAKFEKPLELRKVNYLDYPLFGFLFAETKNDNYFELNNILNSDLKEFITKRE